MMLMAAGMSLTMAPATESSMSSLPLGKAGVGSAVNDTTRQVGGALGVAIIGSVMASYFGSRVADVLGRFGVTGEPVTVAKEGLGQALAVAGDPRLGLSPDAHDELVGGITDAFVSGMHRGLLVAAFAALLGALVAFRYLPAHALPEPTTSAAPEPARTGLAPEPA
jgi:hypothetical protein